MAGLDELPLPPEDLGVPGLVIAAGSSRDAMDAVLRRAAEVTVPAALGSRLTPELPSLRGRPALARAVAAVEMIRDEVPSEEALRLVGLLEEEFARVAAAANRIADRGERADMERLRAALRAETEATLESLDATATGRVPEATVPRVLERTESLYEPTVSEPTMEMTARTVPALPPEMVARAEQIGAQLDDLVEARRPLLDNLYSGDAAREAAAKDALAKIADEEAPLVAELRQLEQEAERIVQEAAPVAEEAAPAAKVAPKVLKSPDITWLAYFRKTLKPQEPSDALRAVSKRIMDLYDDEVFVREWQIKEAALSVTGKTPDEILAAPPAERDALLEMLNAETGWDESDLEEFIDPSAFIGLTRNEALELGAFPKGTKASDLTPQILDDLTNRLIEIAAEVGGPEGLEPALREMGGGAEESLADVRYQAAQLQSRIVPVEKDKAFEFVRKHHSKLPQARAAGVLAAVGVSASGELRVVGLLNHPSGPFAEPFGVVELSRVASDGKLKGGASAITKWAMDNLQKLNRTGDPSKARLVTTALLSEPGEVYRALEVDGLRPTGLVKPGEASGARKGAVGTARKGEWKINWEFGPAAKPAQPHLGDLPPVYRDVVTNKGKLSIKRLNSLVQADGVDKVQAYKDAARVLGVDAKAPEMMATRLASRATEQGREKIANDLRYMLLEKFNSKQVADMDAKEQAALRAAAKKTEAPAEAAVAASVRPAGGALSPIEKALADARTAELQSGRARSGKRPTDLENWDPDSGEFYSDWAIRSIAHDMARLDAQGLSVPPDIMEGVLRGLSDAQDAKADVIRFSDDYGVGQSSTAALATMAPPSSALDQAISRELRLESVVNDIRNGAAGGAAIKPRFTVTNSRAVPGIYSPSLSKDDKYVVVDNWKGRAVQAPSSGKPKYFGFKTRAEGETFVAAQVAEEAARRQAVAAPATPSGITPPVSAPVAAEKIARTPKAAATAATPLDEALVAVKKLRSPEVAEKFLNRMKTSTLAPAEKVQVYDSLATKLEKLAAFEDGDLELETLASTARDAERQARGEAERALRAAPPAPVQPSPVRAAEAEAVMPELPVTTEAAPGRESMAVKQTNQRNPELVAKAKEVMEGRATREDYEALVDKLRPITPYRSLPTPSSEEQMRTALKSNQRGQLGAARSVPAGTPVGLRVDIPALQDHGTWVVTIHGKRKSRSERSLAGQVIGYDNVAVVRNAEFVVPQRNSILIASGTDNKMPYATVEGAWVPMTSDEAVARARAAFNDPEWVQVGQDPLRHAYFYDRATRQPIVGAEEVIQVGPLVLAKKPKYAPKSDFLYQVSPTGAVKGITETLADGRQVILLFQGADASTVMHEVAHIMRRNVLDNDDMEQITRWVTSMGARVTHQYGEFVGSPDEVEKAEELFAKAFERYIREGRAPTPALVSVFNVLKQAIANVYRGIRDPVLGVDLKPEVRQVFDKVLAEVPEESAPTLKQVLRRELLGTDEDEVAGPLEILSQAAQRKGIPLSSMEDLSRQMEAARSRNVPQDATYISFPVPVMGKKDWTFDDLAKMQATREQQHMEKAARSRGIRLDLSGRGKGEAAMITEDTLLESLRGALAPVEGETGFKAGARGALRGIAATFFGGDVVGEKGVRLLPPEMRRALDTTERVIEQGIGDTVSLLNDAVTYKNDRALFRYLGGGSDVRRVDGRPILSAGYDYMGSVRRMFLRALDDLSSDERDALKKMADVVNGPNTNREIALLGFDDTGRTFNAADDARYATQAAYVKALNKVLYAQGKAAESDFGSALASALRGAVEASPTPRPTHEMRLMEVITYVSGMTARDGALFTGTSEEAARILANDVRKLYDEESARRVLVLVGGFGSADKAKLQLVKLNLGVPEETAKAFSNWLVGERWPSAQSENLQRLVDRYGMNPEFVKDTVLDTDFYIPRLARERMAQALARATYRPDVSATGVDAFNFAYRYMKTRMTRGSFFIRQRYYMMNTTDHFIQMGMTAGFGVAAASVTRVIAQDLMVLPGWQQLVEVARKLPGGQRIPVDALERIRRTLQIGGDVVASRIGKMFSASKYRIEVNPILEGLDGGFVAGGKVYTYRDIRNIAVEEGIFASFNTRELANAIQREGELVLSGRGTALGGAGLSAGGSEGGALRNFLADMQKTVENVAEAWGERERLGAMVSLMEAGHDPRTAARLTIDALYDYSQSMTKADRSLLVGVLFPFWAFQKNANGQIFNLMFSPWGAYRMMTIRRARERGAEFLSEVLYNDVGNEYGVDVKSMPPELQDSFYAIVTAMEDHYNGEIPVETKRAMRLIFTGRGRDVMDGKLVELGVETEKLREVGVFAEAQKFAEYAALRPDPAGRSSYMRDRIGISMQFPRTAAVRQYYRVTGDQHAYIEAFLPESSVEAGMKHHTQLLAAYIMMGAAPIDFLTGDLTEGGYGGTSLRRTLEPVVDPVRSPILAPLLADASPDLTPPTRLAKELVGPESLLTRVHPGIGKQMDDLYGTTFVRVPAIRDPFMSAARGEDMKELSEEAVKEIKLLQAQYPDMAVLRDQRYYLPGGIWSTTFQNSPLGELNTLLIRYEDNPLERANIRGQMLRWARGVLGVDVEVVTPSKTARREEPTVLKETKDI